MMTSASLLNESAIPDTYPQLTVKNPVSSTTDEIVKIANSRESDFSEILKCPLIDAVESSIVRKNAWTSMELSSRSSINISVDDGSVALLNFSFPGPGSVCDVSVLNV
jgi:hypothetical protein